ncbi:hypothetical protein [Liquorilactobacillus oeni]|uniref:Uncharacterized protein n=1 Tax=Liquorilactobacillus oeni DSM 19972 TaxID=1423777 RepID=A0A0R1MC22_9LACO|nr:hypothetical protein [Liquorilactobacillus oeni]KRL05612.1 hypothetical protein FD46_GL000356 [Liquorilactobacillus oeni DSM 19972]
MNDNNYRAWLEGTPHIYEINFEKSVLAPQIENFPEVTRLGSFKDVRHKYWLIESTIPDINLFEQCFIAIMKKHRVPTENYKISQLQSVSR